MADSWHRGRSPVRGAPRSIRDDSMEYRSSYDHSGRSSRHSRSPERDRGRRGQHYPDNQYGLPAVDNYRPRYPSPPPKRDSSQKSKGTGTRSSTTDNIHPDRANFGGSGDDLPNRPQVSDLQVKEVIEIAQPSVEVSEGVAAAMQPLAIAVAEYAALEIKKDMAQADFDRRQAEFNSSIGMHEKYPATAESQTRSKNKAEEEVKAAVEALRAKRISLDDLAAKSLTGFIPFLLKAASNLQHQDSQGGRERLERECEELQKRLDDSTKELKEVKRSNKDNVDAIKRLEARQQLTDATLKSLAEKSELRQESEKRFEVQQQSIESRLKSQEHEHKSLEAAQTRLSVEQGYTKILVNEDYKQKISSLEATTDSLSKGLDATKELAAQLQELIPRDLRSRVEQLSRLPDHVASVRVGIDKVTEECQKSANLSQKVKFIEQQLNGQRDTINGLDRIVNGTGSPYSAGLSASITELLKKSTSGTVGLEAFKQVEDRVKGFSDDMTKFNSRLRIVEAQPRPTPSTPSIGSASQAKVEEPEMKRLAMLEQKIARLSNQFAAMDKDLPDTSQSILDTVKKEVFETLKMEVLEVVEAKQSASDAIIGELTTQIEEEAARDRNRLSAVEVHMSSMDKALPKRLERAETLVDLKIKEQLNEATKNFSDSMTAAIKKEVAETVDAAVQPLNSKADALYDGLSVLESRWNNINTRDMAMFIISQLEAAYPDVRNVQDMLSHFKVQLAHYQGEISRITQLVNNFDARLNRLQTEVSQGDSSDKSRQTIRKELDSLSLDISRIQSAADDAKNQRSADQAKTEELRLEMAKEIGRLRLDIGEKKRPDDTTALPSSLNVPRAGLPRSISASAVSSQLLAERIGPPQPLLHGDGSNKKRKLNGSHSSLGSAETLRAPSRSRRRKRHTFGLGDVREDNSDDSTFEPNQPSISDDAEES